MGQCLIFSCRQVQIDECKVCGQSMDNHAPDCLFTEQAECREKQRVITCPKCHRPTVDLNVHDYFECRKCHTQYVAGYPAEELESEDRVPLIDEKNGKPIFAFVLKAKGDGKFVYDKRIANLQKKINKIIKN